MALNDVKTYGACGNGEEDDRVAIQRAIDDARANGKGGIFFPAGTYRVSRSPDAGAHWSLDLHDVEAFAIAPVKARRR